MILSLLSDNTRPPQPSSSIQQLAATGTGTGPSPALKSWKECCLHHRLPFVLFPLQLSSPGLQSSSAHQRLNGSPQKANMVDLLPKKMRKREMLRQKKKKGNVLQTGKQAQKCYETCFRAEVEHRGVGPSFSKSTAPESSCLTACLHLTPWASTSFPGFQLHWAPGFLFPQHMLQGAGRLESLKSYRKTGSGQVVACFPMAFG